MIAVIFEVLPHAEGRARYLDTAAALRPLLEQVDGFISIERFQSLTEPDKILSLSFFRDEAAIAVRRLPLAHRPSHPGLWPRRPRSGAGRQPRPSRGRLSGEASSPKQPNLAFELGLLALLALLWGSSYMLIKVALQDLPPVTLIALRATVAMLFLLAVVRLRRLRLPRDGRTWRQLFVQAIFISIASWLLLAWGQQYVDSGLASVLNSTSPIFVFFITLLTAGKLRCEGRVARTLTYHRQTSGEKSGLAGC